MNLSSQKGFGGGDAFRHCVWRLPGLLGKGARRVGYSLAVLICLAACADAQPALPHSEPALSCDDFSVHALENAIEDHNEHVFRLTTKFKDIWYPQGPIPAEVRKAVTLQNIRQYLAALGERKAAVLFYGFDELLSDPQSGLLRTWLITYRGTIICAKPRTLTKADWKTLQPNGWGSLGVRGAIYPRTATPLDDNPSAPQLPQWGDVLQRLSDILVPREVVAEFETSRIDTLIVVPITVHKTWVPSTLDVPSIRATFSIGVVPFAALPVDGDVLIKKVSTLMAPGFFLFARTPEGVREKYANPIVMGNPVRQGFQPLPGAGAEARYVADSLQTKQLFVEKRASKAILENYLRQNPDSVDFIHLATHGIADAVDPVDKSFLVFSDGVWNAREISHLRRQVKVLKGGKLVNEDLPLFEAKPLVVMSACQTALGKDFPAGTIGLARAWQWAGASTVVMSLWSVDDEATKELMEQFVDLVVKGQAVDKALQTAMLNLRAKYPSPSHWASFSVYGAPERLGAGSTAPEP